MNQGTLAHPGPCRLVFRDGSRLENDGLVDLQGDVTWVDGGGSSLSAVVNTGTLRKSAGSGSATLQSPRPLSLGTMEVLSGTLDLPGGVVGGGTLHAADTTQILYGGWIELTNVVLSGLGLQRVQAGAVLEGTVSAENLEWAGGPIQGTHTLTGTVVWSGGELGGGGTTTVGSQGTLRLLGGGDRNLRGRLLLIQGSFEHVGSCRAVFYDQAHFEIAAGGVVELQSDATWVDGGGSGPSTLINTGTFRKNGGTGTSAVQSPMLDNRGTIGAWQGTLHFGQAPSLQAGSVVEFVLAGTTHPDQYGRITCGQSLRLAGRLAVVFRNGFVPGPGQQFDVMGASILSVFQSYTAPPISATVFINPVYRPDGLSLVTADPTPTLWGLSQLNSEQQCQLNIYGIANQSYVVLGSTDFVDWTPLATNAVPASTVWEFIDVDSVVFPFRFYRVLYQP